MILVAIPAVLLAAVSVVAFLGRWSWVLDVLANFRPQYAGALVVLGLMLLVGRWRRTAVVALAGAAVNLVVVAPLYLGPGSTLAPGEPLTILSYNLLAANDRFGEVTSYLAELDADVVFLHEASRPWEVAVDAADLGYQITRSRSEDRIYGTLVLTRPDADVESFGFGVGSPRAVAVEHAGVAILGIHPLAPITQQRAALRDAQLAYAGRWASDQSGPHVVTGDFNATPWSYPFRRLRADTGLLNSQRGFGLGATFPASAFPLVRFPIDHLLHSDDLAVADRRLGPAMGSDHFPLVVELWAPGSVEPE